MSGVSPSRLIVVSNRVATPSEGKSPSGGLAVAVMAALKTTGGIWFGWSGQTTEQPTPDLHRAKVGKVTFATADLTPQDHDEYYNGYSNSTLWPLFHYRVNLAEFTRRTAQGYRRVNQYLAGKLAPLIQENDTVWVHDYHLIPFAEELRTMGFGQRMGFFLHIPFPTPELMVTLPGHDDLVRSLCAYDVVGFQTPSDRNNFVSYLLRECGAELIHEKMIAAFGRKIWVDAYPISIETPDIERIAEESIASRPAQRLIESIGKRDLILGVDRLDYSKGIPERFQAIDALMENYPDNRGKTVFMQIAPPSRTSVKEYQTIRAELESLAGRINGAYADLDWIPVRYLNKSFTRRTLMGFLRAAKVGLVTPLRDGMNLVAKEFVAAQDPDDPGVLVLSRFAGAADELKDGAVLVNPHDVEGTADQIQRALMMSLDERQGRHTAMLDILRDRDIERWQRRFLTQLAAAPFTGGEPDANTGRQPAKMRVV